MARPRAHEAGAKREAVLVAATDLLLARGYDGMSFDAVAVNAGVSKTTVYAHFPDKPALFEAVMTRAITQLDPDLPATLATDEALDSVERLVRTLSEVVRSATRRELLAFFRVLIAERERREQLRPVLEEMRIAAGAPSLMTLLVPCIEAVAADRGVTVRDPEKWVIVLLRLVAPALQLDMMTSEFDPENTLLDQHVRLVVDIFMNGALPAGLRELTLPEGYDYPWQPGSDSLSKN